MSRICLNVLRQADEPFTTRDIALQLLKRDEFRFVYSLSF
jgi:hypothetical protein